MHLERLCRALIGLYGRVLCLYPRCVREAFGREMAWVFASGLHDAASQGWGGLLGHSLRELWDLPAALLAAWVREWERSGLQVSEGNAKSVERLQQERIRWAPRLPRALIVQLYAQDAQGIVDEALIDRVGAALDARAESMLLVSQRQIRCPRCGRVFGLGETRHDEDVVPCPEPGCGWEASFHTCRNSWRRRHLFGGSLLPVLEAYRADYARAESPRAKLALIDRLLHAFGRDPRSGEVRWPSAGHFIEGKSPRSVVLLRELPYGPHSTPGLVETRERWLQTLALRAAG